MKTTTNMTFGPVVRFAPVCTVRPDLVAAGVSMLLGGLLLVAAGRE